MTPTETQMPTGHSPTIDIAAALRDPGRYFAEPREILDAFGLDRETKLRLLEEWERDARSLAVAEEEGLTDGEPSMLGRIRQARLALGGAEPAPVAGTTKHG
jgi:CO/xanthine dehydrogenase FAD-binding subunit